MKRLSRVWRGVMRRSPAVRRDPVPAEPSPGMEAAALAGLERKLDILSSRGAESGIGERVETEVERFFGGEALRGMQSAGSTSESGTIVFAADRLLVTFLGRSAAMAVTRKLYADRK